MPLLKAHYAPAGSTGAARPEGEARIVGYQRNSVTIEVESERARRARAARHLLSRLGGEVDGERRPMLRANLLFRGVEIRPGGTGSSSNSARCPWKIWLRRPPIS